jgi:hypothetical protein
LVAPALAFGPCIGGQNLSGAGLRCPHSSGRFNKFKNYDKKFPAMNFNVKYMKSKRFRSTNLSTYNKVQTGYKP